ncbi:MAG: AsmA-like C-terminal domain-containing protein [Campylobacterota bacterium]|nr:AsmA-like C-terminal domain-containing protein [Campylobacterota bacterium]
MKATRIISTIHIILAGLIVFLMMSFITLFIVLQNGVLIQTIQLSSVKVDELYIKWNEKLSVVANVIEISTDENKSQTSFNFDSVKNILHNTELFIKWFEKISIHNIHVNDINGSFYYSNDEKGYLKLHSSSFNINSTLQLLSNNLYIKLHSLELKKFDTKIEGMTALDITNRTIRSNLKSHIGDAASLKIELNATKNEINYHITSTKPIKSLNRVVERFELDPVIKFWAVQNIKADTIDLEYIKGIYRFKHPEKFITELDAKARGEKLAYTFSKELAPIKTQYTDVHFKDAVLHIKPHKGTFKHHKLPKGYLDIDFSQEQFHLFAYVITNTMLDRDILKILKTFKIDLPLEQSSGTTDANLNLDINLHTLDTKADGTFKIKEGDFLFKGETLHVKNGEIHILDTHVTVNNALISYEKYIDADVKGYLDPVKNRANLKIRPKRIDVANIQLDQSKLKLYADYKLNSKKETLTLSRSQWNYDGKTIMLDEFEAPFHFNDFHVTLPNIDINFEDILNAKIAGEVDISKLYADINTTVNQLEHDNFKLTTAPLFNLKYSHDEAIIQTKQFNTAMFNNKKIKIAPFKLSLKENSFKVLNSKFYLEDIIDFQLKAEYQIETQTGKIDLDYIQTYPQDIYSSNKPLSVYYKRQDGHSLFSCDTLGIGALVSPTRWQATLSDFSKIASHSKLFQKNFLTDGKMTLFTNDTDTAIKFNAQISYPYAVVIKDEIPQTNYIFEGSYKDTEATFTINKNIHVKMGDTTTVKAKNVGFNVPAIIELLDAQEKAKSTAHHMNFNVTNSFLYISPRRRALISNMKFSKFRQNIKAVLTHKEGSARLQYKDNVFHLIGDNFNDEFMNNLLALAVHKRGSLYFNMYGTPSDFQGILKVNETILKDYKVINNLLAFVNTVPALSTFSLPNYSSKGLKVKEAYGGFTYKRKNISIHDASLDSKELKLRGKGALNFTKNSIDMKLNLKTDLGSQLSKIPIVGYLLFGDDGSVSTTVTIDGKLDDPKVSNAMAKDIVVSPFKLLKRTILLPVHFIENVKEAPDID